MRRTSVNLLLIVLFWMMLMQIVLHAQTQPRVEHSQTMHQYILNEAYRLLQREAPGTAVRLSNHIGSTQPGAEPWDAQTLMSGVYREDEEDIVYGHGGPQDSQQPGFDLEEATGVLGLIYDIAEDEIKNSSAVRSGYVTVTHFWDEHAPDNVLRKSDIRIKDDVGVINYTDLDLSITPAANAWEKIRTLLRPEWAIAVRDRWWDAGEQLYDAFGMPVIVLPAMQSSSDELCIRYNTLVDLYNTGHCSVELPGSGVAMPVVLTKQQRERYVWEILGRACHLLGDMSVPAHTHKDLHMWNMSLSFNFRVDLFRVTIEDEDSYEHWIASPMNAHWTADMIQAGLVSLDAISDPLYHLMSTMRTLAASFASDDYAGEGPYNGIPRDKYDIPNRHNIPQDVSAQKRAMMVTIRDHTLPYAIRATATLLKWFVSQLNMPEEYRIWTMGATGYTDFFVRDSVTQPFPVVPTQTGTLFQKHVGDDLTVRSHIYPHFITASKFNAWKDKNLRETANHQWDDYVLEKQGDVECWFRSSETAQVPQLSISDELGSALHAVYPLFRNPWHVNPQQTTAWSVHQPNLFDRYQPLRSGEANGGMFVDIYDDVTPPVDYYSIRASKIVDEDTKQHKSGSLDVGDYTFLGWETMFADLFPDPKNSMWPPHPAYANPGEYDTKIVDFLDRDAMVNALYKKHRSSDRTEPPTSINSQRKVALDAWDVYHAVYESSGQIWYTRSTDRGVTWSGEQRVSDVTQRAMRPSIAAMADAAWITYVADGKVQLRIAGNNGWESIYSAPVTMVAECTPVVAVLGDFPGAAGGGAAICLVWEDTGELRFTLIHGRQTLVDNAMLVAGRSNKGSIDQPRYPSIAASTEVPSIHAKDHGFHIAWIEHGNVYYIKLAIDRRTNPVTLAGWRPGGAVAVETVHARTGSVGCVYPARHAPSIAVTTQGTVHVAFDVLNWHSPWPTNGGFGTPGSWQNPPNSLFAVCERGLPTINGPTWQTTTTLIGGSSVSSLCSPTVGARPASFGRGSKSNGLRVIFNDRQGQLRVVRFDGNLQLAFHAEGWDPSVTAWAPDNDGLVDMYSYTAQPPYSWHLIASQNALAKNPDDRLVRMRQILLSHEDAFAGLGISMPRLLGDDGVRPIEWNEAHDSLLLGVQVGVPEKMRTATFTPNAATRLLLDIERFAFSPRDTRAEFLIRVNDAKSGEALRVISLPINAFTSAAAMAVQEIDLSSLNGTPLFISADVYSPDVQWSAAVVDRYALAEEKTDTPMEKNTPVAAARRAVLKQNHPNPFNPSTGISYHLPEAGETRLAVYNLLGKEVALLHSGWAAAGDHTVSFDGAALPSGVYLYRLEHGGAVQTRSMHLLK